jgi:HD-like signal output (HDOD) protein
MKVIFVDDERRVLEGVERMLFQFDLDWDVSFVNTSAEALELLAGGDIDVIVSDMRMPRMDGAALLAHVCEHHPNVVRIIFSGQTDEESSLRVVRLAHQFLAKPCQPETIRQVIERTRELKILLDDPKLQAHAGRIDRLPSVPRLFSELSRLLESEKADVDAITRVVQQDPAMASKLLQLVNSAFFSASSTVKDLKTAVLRLGLRTLRSLALSVGAFEAAGGCAQQDLVSVDDLQQHSLKVALVAARIAPPEDADEAFIAGLVGEIGQLLLAAAAPDRLRNAMALASERGIPLHEAETEVFGVTHAEVGAFLLGLWGLPFRIVEAVANYHRPDRNAHDRWGLSQAVWLAECFVSGREPDAEYLARIGVTEKLSRFRQAADKILSS